MNNDGTSEEFTPVLEDFFVDQPLSRDELKKGFAELLSISENEIFIYEDDDEFLKEIDKNSMYPYLLQIFYVPVKGDFSILLKLQPTNPDVDAQIQDSGRERYTFISDFSKKFQCRCAIDSGNNPILRPDDFYLIDGYNQRQLIVLYMSSDEEKPIPDDEADYYFIDEIDK
ncbi:MULTISPECIES: hypothetical protein [Microcystis]|jgi:hypothetical protein|uniref:Uncharacterized protein n=1 Tax=Microcystis aeruginosa NIES-4285 TaxID=2497681 RepID=A0A402DJT1_MICAE|nr:MULTISPECIES: hypothetical protein [Microcystis]MCZ8307948.1 hypothetical protein [Microcystis sp. LE19-98.1E]MCA2692943.1 hypothetical protein [Microcystis sp. M034S2]MCA2750953.1 hypothetical protein [Microcystis sp. M144S2]MCZ8200533.1 hypothetical protein [Microcystis sp. LE19-55.1A]GCE62476.1 hypothetical protein MiAbB_04423 [Microcystis aeruginosa NIES-4285]